MIWRIREMLSFQTETRPVCVHGSALASGRSIKKITAVKLDPRFGREYFQHPATARFENLRGRLQPAASESFELAAGNLFPALIKNRCPHRLRPAAEQ